MMNTTHGAIGVALASVTVLLAPEFAAVAAVAALLGSVFPDLDLFVGTHRKTLHFPVIGWALALPATAWAALVPSTASVGTAFFALGATVHAVTDAAGAGHELRPWERTSQQAVYAHFPGRWIAPRRWIRYDGAPEDLALMGVVSLPVLILYDGFVRNVMLVALGISVFYTTIRKRMPDLTPEWLK
ncbi:metal-dependent hydrolase [Halalkalicoccus subterraneus]|uniref:metal-dependent hydrolase n=1 Tax=Halalkalicoccus subterraneus TaxID=2675002 RepID=UPI000EFCBBE3